MPTAIATQPGDNRDSTETIAAWKWGTYIALHVGCAKMISIAGSFHVELHAQNNPFQRSLARDAHHAKKPRLLTGVCRTSLCRFD